MQARYPSAILALIVLLTPVLGSGCAGLVHEHLVYSQYGIQIGVETDPTTGRTSPPTPNGHPAPLTAQEIRQLLSLLQVSGYTGTLAGLLATPPPISLFTQEELDLIASPVAEAFHLAGPRERVFFSLQNLRAPYERDRTAGALFVRGPYLYVLLRDHAAFPRTDTGGSDDDRDPRDTKGLTLSVAWPARAALVSEDEWPRWGPFEKIHLALDIRKSLAAVSHAREASQAAKAAPVPRTGATGPAPADSQDDLRLTVRELTLVNQELRARLQAQAQQLEALKEELSRIRRELEAARSGRR